MGRATLKPTRRQVLGIAAGGVAGAIGFRYLSLALPGTSPTAAVSAAGPDGAWASPLTTKTGLAAHLLRRAGFTYTEAELESAASMSYPDLVDMVVNQEPEPLPAVADPTRYELVVRTWYEHMATTSAQFPERMTLFWHGLLTSDYHKAARLPFVDVTNLHAVDRDRAGIVRLEQVHASQHGGLAAARGTDDADDLAARDVQIDATQHLVLAEALAQVAHLHERSATIRGHRRNGPPNVGSTGRACS